MEDLTVYEFGKQAALEDLLNVADELGDINGVWGVVSETLETPLEKNASVEDQTLSLGTEAICYSFLKEASAYYGEYDVEDHEQALSEILVKVAEDFVQSLQKEAMPSYMADGKGKKKQKKGKKKQPTGY
jgi:hypothetical protein